MVLLLSLWIKWVQNTILSAVVWCFREFRRKPLKSLCFIPGIRVLQHRTIQSLLLLFWMQFKVGSPSSTKHSQSSSIASKKLYTVLCKVMTSSLPQQTQMHLCLRISNRCIFDSIYQINFICLWLLKLHHIRARIVSKQRHKLWQLYSRNTHLSDNVGPILPSEDCMHYSCESFLEVRSLRTYKYLKPIYNWRAI